MKILNQNTEFGSKKTNNVNFGFPPSSLPLSTPGNLKIYFRSLRPFPLKFVNLFLFFVFEIKSF